MPQGIFGPGGRSSMSIAVPYQTKQYFPFFIGSGTLRISNQAHNPRHPIRRNVLPLSIGSPVATAACHSADDLVRYHRDELGKPNYQPKFVLCPSSRSTQKLPGDADDEITEPPGPTLQTCSTELCRDEPGGDLRSAAGFAAILAGAGSVVET